MNWRYLLAAFLWLSVVSCSSGTVPPITQHIQIIYPAGSSRAIALAATDLQQDLAVISGARVTVAKVAIATSQPQEPADLTIVIGQQQQLIALNMLDSHSHQLLAAITEPRAGLMHQQAGHSPIIVLAGADVQGTQYSVYDFSQQFLGTDPLAYWTGSTAEPVSFNHLLTLTTKQIAAPVVPLLVYFENDVDELAPVASVIIRQNFA